MLASSVLLLALAATPVPQGLKASSDVVITLAFRGTEIANQDDNADDAAAITDSERVDLDFEVKKIVEHFTPFANDHTFGYDVMNVVQQDVAHHYEKVHAHKDEKTWEAANNGKPWLTADLRVWVRHTDASLADGNTGHTQKILNEHAENLWEQGMNSKSGLRSAVPKLMDSDVNCGYKRDWYSVAARQKKDANALKDSATVSSTHFARAHCSARDDFDGHGNRWGLGLGLGFTVIVFGGLLGVMM